MSDVAVLGIYVADLAFLAGRMPHIGETVMGSGFRMGPGGKGGNQAVAAVRAGASTTFLSKVGRDAFAQAARAQWAAEGLDTLVLESESEATGAAFIFVNEQSGDNAVLVVPGASSTMTVADLQAFAPAISSARVLLTQLEAPPAVTLDAMAIAKSAGVTTVFNPAPAIAFDPQMLRLADVVTPNESEAQAITGVAITSLEDARAAAEKLMQRGARTVLLTLGEQGCYYHSAQDKLHIPAVAAGKVIDTTGAGDALNGAFAAALAAGMSGIEAAHFATIAAGIAVTRAGTAPAMAYKTEIETFMRGMQ